MAENLTSRQSIHFINRNNIFEEVIKLFMDHKLPSNKFVVAICKKIYVFIDGTSE